MNSRKSENCNVDVHRASYAKHLRSKKHIEIDNQNETIIPEYLFQEPIENKNKKNCIILNHSDKKPEITLN